MSACEWLDSAGTRLNRVQDVDNMRVVNMVQTLHAPQMDECNDRQYLYTCEWRTSVPWGMLVQQNHLKSSYLSSCTANSFQPEQNHQEFAALPSEADRWVLAG